MEDHAALGEALLFAFSFESGIDVVGLAPTVSTALEMVAAAKPDVVLMDVRLPDGNGIDATSRVMEVHPGAAVVVLTAHADPVFALRAADAGAAGFMPKDVRIAKVVDAVRRAMAGEATVEGSVLRSLLARAAADGPAAGVADGNGFPRLSPGEVSVLGFLAEGLGTAGIADALGVGFDEAGASVARAVADLGARSRLEALVIAARHGLLSPPGS
ncbi:MAG TPA: response regulator transcription factor [Acidimicrobiia bacterium]|nr:response regulator transcription factor [Acidimicrobiia bacterium]